MGLCSFQESWVHYVHSLYNNTAEKRALSMRLVIISDVEWASPLSNDVSKLIIFSEQSGLFFFSSIHSTTGRKDFSGRTFYNSCHGWGGVCGEGIVRSSTLPRPQLKWSSYSRSCVFAALITGTVGVGTLALLECLHKRARLLETKQNSSCYRRVTSLYHQRHFRGLLIKRACLLLLAKNCWDEGPCYSLASISCPVGKGGMKRRQI